MRIAFVYWTFELDAALLAQSFRSIERLRARNPEDVLDVFVRDDASRPLLAPPDGVDYRQTAFDRRGNLNGLACVRGMIAEYLPIAEAGYDWIVKVDSDTWVNDIEWLRAADARACVSCGTYNWQAFAHGFCYAFSAEGVRRLAALLSREDLLPRLRRRVANGSTLPEDCTFGLLAPLTGLRPHKLFNRRNEPGASRAGYFAYDVHGLDDSVIPPPAAMLRNHCAVTFKLMSWMRTPDQRQRDRAFALANMLRYAESMALSDQIEAEKAAAQALEAAP